MHIYIHSPYSNTYTYNSNTNALCTCVLYSTAQPSTKARISAYRALAGECKTYLLHAHRQYRAKKSTKEKE